MNLIKGFVSIAQFISNTPGTTAALGDLSTWSKTYSREVGEYQDNTLPGYKLYTFRNLDTATGVPFELTNVQVNEILDVVRQAIVYTNGKIRPYDPVDFQNTLSALLFSKISNLNFGEFVDNGTIALPAWISWNSLQANHSFVKVWLSDSAFADQFDDYEIVVVPPLDILDNFFNGYSIVVNELASLSTSQMADKIHTAKNNQPETVLRIPTFEFINPLNSAQKTITNWPVLIYGKAGDNVDAIKEALTNYVLANSSRTEDQWRPIIPSLFAHTEFIFLPRWDKYSIPNLTQLAGLYSSVVNPAECIAFARDNIPFYDSSWVEANISILPYDYKCIALLCINGQNNVQGSTQLSELFPDYIPVPSTNLDFSRMQINTREWVLLMGELLIAAETADEFSTVPSSLRRIKRNGVLFISALYENVNYLVAARSNSFYG